MSAGTRLSYGNVGRLVAAVGAAFAGAQIPGDPALGAALGTVAAGFLINRANAAEAEQEADIDASHNHHLQLALAGAFRLALDNLKDAHPGHEQIFGSWQKIIEAALDRSTNLLAFVIPAEFDPVLDVANPYVDQKGAYDEAEWQLRSWLAYQRAFERTGEYPTVPVEAPPELPSDLAQRFRVEFLPEVQKAFANLLTRNDGEYARRAFARRSLQELVAGQRKQTAILEKHSEILHRLDARLRLDLAPLRPPAPLDDTLGLAFLRAENRTIRLVGREQDLADLEVWLRSKADVSVCIVTGPAGAGKTRLAIQLLEQLEGSGWAAGFLRESEIAGAKERYWDRPTLAVVDYADSSVSAVKTWLEYLAERSFAQPLRILLLAREASPETGWLRLLLDRTSTGDRIAALLDPSSPRRVTPLTGVGLRRQILDASLKRLGARSTLPAPGTDNTFEQRLAESRWQEPLYLMMAALVAHQSGGLPEALSLSHTELAFRLADHELGRIRKFLPAGAPDESADLLVRLAGIVTACRSLERNDLIAIAGEEGDLMGVEFPGGARVAALRVADALNRDGKPAPIEPDIIGEAVLLRCFGGENAGEGTRALVRAARRGDHRYAGSVCFAITRTCQDFASERCQEPLDWVEEFIRTGASDDLGLLLQLEGQMPHDTLILRERAVRVDELLLERLTGLSRGELPGEAPETGSLQATLAMLANNLANRLSALGRREEALAQAEGAVRIFRQLAQQRALDGDSAAFLPDLAGSLNTLANMLSDVGRREEALAQVEEAVRICRQLEQQRPDTFLPDMAMSLHNLASRLSELGRWEEALAQAEEAVRIYRQLAQLRLDAFLPNLATALNNQANILGDLGRREEALAQAEEALRIYRHLTQQRPDAFLPDVAMSLGNLANRLSGLGRQEEALAHAEEAVRIRRYLAQQRPDAFLPDLAGSLNNLANMLSDLGRREEALAQGEESARIRRQLAQQRPTPSCRIWPGP